MLNTRYLKPDGTIALVEINNRTPTERCAQLVRSDVPYLIILINLSPSLISYRVHSQLLSEDLSLIPLNTSKQRFYHFYPCLSYRNTADYYLQHTI